MNKQSKSSLPIPDKGDDIFSSERPQVIDSQYMMDREKVLLDGVDLSKMNDQFAEYDESAVDQKVLESNKKSANYEQEEYDERMEVSQVVKVNKCDPKWVEKDKLESQSKNDHFHNTTSEQNANPHLAISSIPVEGRSIRLSKTGPNQKVNPTKPYGCNMI